MILHGLFSCWSGTFVPATLRSKEFELGWRATLEAQAPDAVGFYSIIAAATVIGFTLGFTGIDAIHMLVWSAVLNGVVAVPIMAMMMVIVSIAKLMDRFRARSWLVARGWVGSAIMAVAVIALLWSSFADS